MRHAHIIANVCVSVLRLSCVNVCVPVLCFALWFCPSRSDVFDMNLIITAYLQIWVVFLPLVSNSSHFLSLLIEKFGEIFWMTAVHNLQMVYLMLIYLKTVSIYRYLVSILWCANCWSGTLSELSSYPGHFVERPISWIIFICGTNTNHEGMMCHIPFPSQSVKDQGHTDHLNFCRWGRVILVDNQSTISCFLSIYSPW